MKQNNSDLPKDTDFLDPIIIALANPGGTKVLYDAMEAHFKLTDEQRNRTYPKGQKDCIFNNRILWALEYLHGKSLRAKKVLRKFKLNEAGLVDRSEYAFPKLTDAGKQRLAELTKTDATDVNLNNELIAIVALLTEATTRLNDLIV